MPPTTGTTGPRQFSLSPALPLRCRPAATLYGAQAKHACADASATWAAASHACSSRAAPRAAPRGTRTSASGAGSSDAAQPAPEQQPQRWNTLGVSSTGAEAAAGQGGVEPQAAMPHGPTCACCQPGRGAGPIRQVITYVDGVVLEVESADGSVVYLDQEDQGGEAAAAAGGRWGAAGGAWGEAGVVVEAEVVSVPTGADSAQYIVFEGEEEEVEEEAGAGGRTGTREAGAARAGRFVPTRAVAGQPFVYVPDVELRGTGRSDSPSIY